VRDCARYCGDSIQRAGVYLSTAASSAATVVTKTLQRLGLDGGKQPRDAEGARYFIPVADIEDTAERLDIDVAAATSDASATTPKGEGSVDEGAGRLGL
jgi:hypothetical protein